MSGNRFLGIRYTRAKRFERPELVAYDPSAPTDAFGPSAPQVADLVEVVPGAPITDMSEDCLFLNVWTPGADGLADASGGSPKPVLVWFHGGSFILGSTSQAVYDGARFAEDNDVIIVSANYRVGALGFLDTRCLDGGVTNLGMHDAIAALRWVQKNIASFGGDPSRVTIFGESAGGGMVLHLLGSAATKGLFRSAIAQSGLANGTLTHEKARLVAETLCETLGVEDLDEMRRLPVETITEAQGKVVMALMKEVGMMPFHPCIDGDLLLDAPAAAFARGVGAGVPLLAGTTSEEMRLYIDPKADPPERPQLVKRVSRYLEVDADRAEQVIEGYSRVLGTDNLGEVWAVMLSDAEMQVPLRAMIDAHAVNGPMFTYLFTWQAPELGAFHAVDLPFTFNTFDADGWGTFVGEDDDAHALSALLQRSWAAFARDDSPGWEQFPETMVFGRTSQVETDPMGERLAALAD